MASPRTWKSFQSSESKRHSTGLSGATSVTVSSSTWRASRSPEATTRCRRTRDETEAQDGVRDRPPATIRFRADREEARGLGPVHVQGGLRGWYALDRHPLRGEADWAEDSVPRRCRESARADRSLRRARDLQEGRRQTSWNPSHLSGRGTRPEGLLRFRPEGRDS